MFRRFAAAALVAAALGGAFVFLGTGAVLAGPKADLWDRWLPYEPGSALGVDHDPWARFVERYARSDEDGIVRVAYACVADEDRASLHAYLETLQETPVGRLDRDEQFAFWVNLYNAATVALILEHYPVSSIRSINISPGLFTRGPWRLQYLEVEGEAVSLDDIEHRILRPIWKDARIHYAVNCASLGCPDLLGAFTAANTEDKLAEGARRFVNHPRGADVEDGRLTVSSIYHWFKEDFGNDDAGVISHLREHALPELAQALDGITRVSRHQYDWSLNDMDCGRLNPG